MTRILAILLAAGLLAACSGGGGGSNPFDRADEDTGGGGDTTPPPALPETVRGDLTRVVYDPARDTIVVEGITLDGLPFATVYGRVPAMEANVPGYRVFTAQNDPFDRHSTAFVREAANGQVRGGAVATGGPRNRFFGGAYFERDGAFTPPPINANSGLVTYSGTYAGLTNVSGSRENLLPVPDGTPVELRPNQAAEVRGDVFMNADFADNSIEGNVINRRLEGGLALPSVVLVSTGIRPDGTFFGETVEYQGIVGTDIGDYAGTIGGTNASGLAGGLRLTEWDGQSNPLGFENEQEYGVFVLERCGTSGVNDSLGVCPRVN